MINNIFKSIKEKVKNYNLLIVNFGYLSIFQFINLIIPLITYPYLIRVLGKETYGLVVFAQAIITYLVILVNFGFNLSATKEVSIHRNDPKKLNEIVSSIFIVKGLLVVIAFLILSILVFSIPLINTNKLLFFLSMYACIYDLIFPIWYFQGVEKMKYITLINITSRLIFLVFIFVLIKTNKDYLLVPIIYGIGALIAGLFSLYILYFKENIRFTIQKIEILMKYTRDSFSYFISNISIQVYVNANKVIVGSFLGLGEVAIYDLAEKLVSVMKIPLSLISQTIFPKVSKDLDKAFVWKMFKYILMLNLIIFIGALLTAPFIVNILGGDELMTAVEVLRLLAITVPIIGISHFLGIQLLIPFGFNKAFAKIIVLSGIVFLILFTFLFITKTLNIYSITMMTVLTEIYVTTHMFFICKQKKLLWKNMTI